jgi:integrase
MPKINKSVVDNAEAPAKGDTWIWDSELEGFGIRIQASGRKTYVVRYRARDAARTQRKMTIARCSDLPPDRAREQARKVFASIAEGEDPAGEKHKARAAAAPNQKTVERMFQAYVAHLKEQSPDSAVEVERVLLKAKHNAADALGRETAAADVTPADVVKYVAGYFKRGYRGAADKARAYISGAYGWAIKAANDYTVDNPEDWGVTVNPVSSVARDPDAITPRERNLSADELGALWRATTTPDESGFSLETAICIQVLIGTGQRVQETLRLDGAEIDLDAGLWHMPKHKTKTRMRAHTIPLPRQVLPGLVVLKGIYGDGPLFPGRRGQERMGHRSVNQAIGRWLECGGVEVAHFQTRDLRRTWKSRAKDAGISREMRDSIQQHAKNDTGSKHYDWADYLPDMRAAMNQWSDWLDALLREDHDEQQIAA